MADLSKLWEQIDQADQDLVKALVKKYDLVMEVGRVKREKGQAVYQEIMDQAKRLEEDF
ncbi:chorismate mutase [Lactobacillus delbrueckii]|uniref:Chorismate mutase n=1 Tax=Lactobacillus delbrueckii TaxID=1584 RepID=A0AAW5YSF4_9LACO|nr:chorismate mutase [Lactobacillus delbrueckii]MCT2879177.1 chorismate mutase [Lactobacillus delbrueckii]MCT3492696.1 chorismate mutase [Lactobacillus delbrueckii]MDA3767031.1 chorismate mutase [Lactobacillus delbrueckii]MDF4028915.1 chorismate mutase [Lactobacillus delbrueckii]GHN36269.1 chorismate mutase [Lactobacillus delbrueckii]